MSSRAAFAVVGIAAVPVVDGRSAAPVSRDGEVSVPTVSAGPVVKSELTTIPECAERQLVELQLEPAVLRDLELASRTAVHQRNCDPSSVDRRDLGFLLRTLDGTHRHLANAIKCDVIDELKARSCQRRRPPRAVAETETVRPSRDLAVSDEVAPALEQLRDVDEHLDLEMRARSLSVDQLEVLRAVLEDGVRERTELARVMNVSRPTAYKRIKELAADLQQLGAIRGG